MTKTTEQEAKTKWCPFALVVTPIKSNETDEFFGVAAGNRLGLSASVAIQGSTDRANPESARCLGSACMAWRWGGSWPLPDDPPSISERYDGYCGLAGKP